MNSKRQASQVPSKRVNYHQFTQQRLTEALNKNSSKIKAAQRKQIPNSLIFQNSLNIFCGKQGSGKTMTAIKEIIKISENSPETHLLFYINKSGEHDDLAFESTSELIKVPIRYISQANASSALKTFFEYKQMYKEIKDNKWEKDLPKQAREELLDNLVIEDLNRPFLHTLILFEDTANSPLMKDPYVLDILAKCRHYQVSCFLPVQYWKSLPSPVKENASLVFYFGGYPPRAFYYFVSQIYTQEDHRELFEKYNTLTTHDMMVCDTYTGGVMLLNRNY